MTNKNFKPFPVTPRHATQPVINTPDVDAPPMEHTYATNNLQPTAEAAPGLVIGDDASRLAAETHGGMSGEPRGRVIGMEAVQAAGVTIDRSGN